MFIDIDLKLPFIAVFSTLFLLNIAYANEAGKHRLPRSFGPVTLGMTVKVFQRIAKVEVGRCVHCRKKELYAYFYIDKKAAEHFREEPIGIKRAYLEYQPNTLRPEAVHLFFYEDRLYSIIMTGVKDTIKSVRSQYVKVFGNPSGVETWGSGLSELRWQRSSTQLTVTYATQKKGIDNLEVRYVDMRIMEKIPNK